LGELSWALLRGSIYAAAFLVTMALLGLVSSPWGILCLPAAMLIGFAFAGAGMAATTFMRSFVDFDYVNLALIPLFLFSATFFPLSRYPTALQWVIQVTPLYQGVVLVRSLAFGDLSWTLVLHAAYLVTMGVVGVRVAGRPSPYGRPPRRSPTAVAGRWARLRPPARTDGRPCSRSPVRATPASPDAPGTPGACSSRSPAPPGGGRLPRRSSCNSRPSSC